MIRMSTGFRVRCERERGGDTHGKIVLQPRLRALVEAPLAWVGTSLVLEPLAATATSPEFFQDRTGYEAFINKIHIDDYIDDCDGNDRERLGLLFFQGVEAAFDLSKRLEAEGRFRVLLTLDPESPTMTLRFFERRDGGPWGPEDPDASPLEDVLMIDTGS